MMKRINVLSTKVGQAFRATEDKAVSLVSGDQGFKFIPKKKLKALIKTQKKRNEQDRIAHERVLAEQKRQAARKQAYQNMLTLKAQSSPEPLGPKDI
jgi:hypothetical protein